jgi:hypothetical protein
LIVDEWWQEKARTIGPEAPEQNSFQDPIQPPSYVNPQKGIFSRTL